MTTTADDLPSVPIHVLNNKCANKKKFRINELNNEIQEIDEEIEYIKSEIKKAKEEINDFTSLSEIENKLYEKKLQVQHKINYLSKDKEVTLNTDYSKYDPLIALVKKREEEINAKVESFEKEKNVLYEKIDKEKSNIITNNKLVVYEEPHVSVKYGKIISTILHQSKNSLMPKDNTLSHNIKVSNVLANCEGEINKIDRKIELCKKLKPLLTRKDQFSYELENNVFTRKKSDQNYKNSLIQAIENIDIQIKNITTGLKEQGSFTANKYLSDTKEIDDHIMLKLDYEGKTYNYVYKSYIKELELSNEEELLEYEYNKIYYPWRNIRSDIDEEVDKQYNIKGFSTDCFTDDTLKTLYNSVLNIKEKRELKERLFYIWKLKVKYVETLNLYDYYLSLGYEINVKNPKENEAEDKDFLNSYHLGARYSWEKHILLLIRTYLVSTDIDHIIDKPTMMKFLESYNQLHDNQVLDQDKNSKTHLKYVLRTQLLSEFNETTSNNLKSKTFYKLLESYITNPKIRIFTGPRGKSTSEGYQLPFKYHTSNSPSNIFSKFSIEHYNHDNINIDE